VAAALDFVKSLSRPTRVFAGGHIPSGFYKVEKVMGSAGTIPEARLGRADLKFAVHRDRVAIDDFALESFCEGEGECCFATGGGTEDDD